MSLAEKAENKTYCRGKITFMASTDNSTNTLAKIGGLCIFRISLHMHSNVDQGKNCKGIMITYISGYVVIYQLENSKL